METIQFQGERWQLHRATARRLIFHPVNTSGKKFVRWRKSAGLNQRDAAQKLGISQTQLAKIELGSRTAPAELLAVVS